MCHNAVRLCRGIWADVFSMGHWKVVWAYVVQCVSGYVGVGVCGDVGGYGGRVWAPHDE